MADELKFRHEWTFCVAAMGLWLAYGWPVMTAYFGGDPIRGGVVPMLWFVPYAVMGVAVLAAMTVRLPSNFRWGLVVVQLLAVVGMTLLVPWAGMSSFLVIIAWQVGMAVGPTKALSWLAFQNLVIVGTLAQALNPDLCWVLTKSAALQLLFLFTAQAMRREAGTARALALTNDELVAAQALAASRVRDAERLRISRELHDAWGHELTALGLQLEIASHVKEPGKANAHVLQAKGLASDLLGKVRDVVSTLREAERGDLKESLAALARSVPSPAIHVDVSPAVRVNPEQAHALIRCAQEAATNAMKHSDAANLWLEVAPDGNGVRLVARNDGTPRAAVSRPGSGLKGMRERLEGLGGRLAVREEGETGFTLDAWLPSRNPQPA